MSEDDQLDEALVNYERLLMQADLANKEAREMGSAETRKKNIDAAVAKFKEKRVRLGATKGEE